MTGRSRAIGGWIVLLALSTAVLVGSGWAPVPAAAVEDGEQVTGAEAEQLYLRNCASCHGPQGEGTALGPSLVGVGAASANFYLRTGRMPLGAPGQQPVRHPPVFDEAQIAALVAYVARFGDGPEIPQVAAGGDLREGWRLYTANCAACHAATGSGNAVGGDATAVGLRRADPTTIAEAIIIGPGQMPRFNFDPADRDAIVAYVEFLQQAPSPGGLAIGGFGPVAEGFVAVVIGLTMLVLSAVFVGRRTHAGEPGGPAADQPSVGGAEAERGGREA